jgi:putative membrane protein
MNTRLGVLALTAAITLMPVVACTPTNGIQPPQPPVNTGSLAVGDASFLREAAQTGLAEIRLGGLAVQRTQNPDVANFSRRMVDDQVRVLDELRQIAQSAGADVPTAPNQRQLEAYQQLSHFGGDYLDHLYMIEVLVTHREKLSMLRHVAATSNNPQLASWARNALPIIASDAQLAETITRRNDFDEPPYPLIID